MSCADSILNQGELKTAVDFGSGNISDCGGNFCPVCPSCFDGIQNQQETGVDCGGPCRSCITKEPDDDRDHDGVSDAIELQQGTDPLQEDTDQDGVLDNDDSFPLCPNLVCDEDYGETTETCPEDCKSSASSFLWMFVFLVLLLVFIGYIFFALKKNKQSSAKKPLQPGQQRQKTSFSYSPSATMQQPQLKSAVEKELEKSLEKADTFFKK